MWIGTIYLKISRGTHSWASRETPAWIPRATHSWTLRGADSLTSRGTDSWTARGTDSWTSRGTDSWIHSCRAPRGPAYVPGYSRPMLSVLSLFQWFQSIILACLVSVPQRLSSDAQKRLLLTEYCWPLGDSSTLVSQQQSLTSDLWKLLTFSRMIKKFKNSWMTWKQWDFENNEKVIGRVQRQYCANADRILPFQNWYDNEIGTSLC